MADESQPTMTDRTREIAKTIGELHAETIKFRRAGLPPKFLGGLDAIDKILARLADQNAALSEASAPAAPSAYVPDSPADASSMKK